MIEFKQLIDEETGEINYSCQVDMYENNPGEEWESNSESLRTFVRASTLDSCLVKVHKNLLEISELAKSQAARIERLISQQEKLGSIDLENIL